MKRKISMILLAVVMVVGFMPVVVSAVNITAEQGVAWAISQVGTSPSQCVVFMGRYIREVLGWNVRGLANPMDLFHNVVLPNSQWIRFATTNLNDVRAGDIIITNPFGDNIGHGGIAIGDGRMVDANGCVNWNDGPGTPPAIHDIRHLIGIIRPPYINAGPQPPTSAPTNVRVNNVASFVGGNLGPSLRVDQGENITVSWTGVTGSTGYRVQALNWNESAGTWVVDNAFTRETTVAGVTSLSIPNLPARDWAFIVTARNAVGLGPNSGRWYMLRVNPPVPPGKPALLNMSSQYFVGIPITFAWLATTNTTGYWFYIDRYAENGTWDRIEATHHTILELNRTLSAGSYRVFIQSVNSNIAINGYAIFTNGDMVYFDVIYPSNAPPTTNTTVTTSEENYNLNVSITNPTNGRLIVSTFNNAGRMIETRTEPITATTTNVPLTFVRNLGATNAKVMIWDGFDNMRPLILAPEVVSLP